MTHISKEKLQEESQKKLTRQLVALFASADKKKSAVIFEHLFSDAEQVMFIKRLAIILMLERGYSRYRISKTLLVSESTVKQFLIRYNAGEFAVLVKSVQDNSFDTKVFWKTVEVLLRGGLPPRTKDKWKHVPGMGDLYCD